MSFWEDLLQSGSDLFTNTFDPKYGILGRPVSGALRSALDIGASVDPFKYIYRAGAAAGIPGAEELSSIKEKQTEQAQKFLDETIGAGLGRKMIGEPVQEMAERATGTDFGREVPTGELLRSAVLPDITPADVEGSHSPLSNPAIRHQVGGAVESVGNLVEMAPELATIPAAPGVGLAFLPGIAESLGTNLGQGEYGKALIDAIFAGGVTAHGVGAKARTSETPMRSESVQEFGAPKITTTPEHALEGLVPGEGLNEKFGGIVEGFVNDAKSKIEAVTQDPRIHDVKVRIENRPAGKVAQYDPSTHSIALDATQLMQLDPKFVSDTIIEELAHSIRSNVHRFGGERVSETGEKTGFDVTSDVPNIDYTIDVGEVTGSPDIRFPTPPKTVEYSPELVPHEVGQVRGNTGELIDPRRGRAQFQPEESSLMSTIDAIANAIPDERFGLADKIARLQAERMGGESTSPANIPYDPRFAAPEGGRPKGVSEPAYLLKKILEATKTTRFNKALLVKDLEAKGIPVPEEVKAKLPELLNELRERGHINEKIAGTFTVNTGPPKNIAEIGRQKLAGTAPKDLESVLKKSIEEASKVEEKPPSEEVTTPEDVIKTEKQTTENAAEAPKLPGATVSEKMGKLNMEEIKAIGKLFGIDKEPSKPLKSGKEYVKEAQDKAEIESALAKAREAARPKKRTSESETEAVDEGEPPIPTEDIIEIEGTKRLLKEQEREAIKSKAPEQAKGQIKETQKLLKAQAKEKLAKKPYTVTLSNNEEVTIRGRSEGAVRKFVERKIKETGSNLGINTITEKKTVLEKKLETGTGGKGGGGKEPPKFGRESITPEDSFSQAWKKLSPTEKVTEVMSIIKAMRASGDLGHLLRQGKVMTVDFLTTGNAKALHDALKNMGKATFSEEKFNALNEAHAKDPITKKLVEDFGLDLPGVAGHLKEEVFHTGTAEKIPGLGKYWIKPSERAYTSFLNEARVSEAKRLIKIAEDAGFSMDTHPEVFKSLMKAVNVLSSRGDFKKIGPTLNSLSNLFWAPRLKLSRAQLIASALGHGEMHPFARAELRKSLGRTTAVNMALLGLAAMAGAKVETDPKSSDWGRIVVGKTRIDPWFGLQPIVRSAVLLYLGESKSATTGRTMPITPPEVIGRQVTSGLAPGPSLAYELGTGKSVSGYPINRGERAWLGLTPMIFEDIYDALKEYGLIGGLVGPASFLGEGVNTYRESPTSRTNKKKKGHKSFNLPAT